MYAIVLYVVWLHPIIIAYFTHIFHCQKIFAGCTDCNDLKYTAHVLYFMECYRMLSTYNKTEVLCEHFLSFVDLWKHFQLSPYRYLQHTSSPIVQT